MLPLLQPSRCPAWAPQKSMGGYGDVAEMADVCSRSGIAVHDARSVAGGTGTGAHAAGAIGGTIQTGENGIGYERILRGRGGHTARHTKGRNSGCAVYRQDRSRDKI